MNFEKKLELNLKNYAIRKLVSADVKKLQQLCERCHDYYEICEGRIPNGNDGIDILQELPPNKNIKDKYVLGVFAGEENLVAVIDLIKDYPEAGEWIIGLMMIEPGERGKGLGRRLHEFLVEKILTEGHRKLRIGVVEDNKKGFAFWKSLGYYEVKRVTLTFGKVDKPVIVMNFHL